jgi:glucose/arabinose dehydrogenase
VPPGFRVNIFHEGFRHARWLAVAENGDVFVAETRADRVRLIRDADGDGIAEELHTFSDEIARPHGLAVAGGHLYVSDPRQVWRYAYRPGQTERAHSAELVTPAGALGDGGGHSTRSLAVSPDGRHLYVAVGSRGNLAEEREPRASVQRFTLDGKEQATFASGLRNPVGIAFRPGTSELYVTVNERDGLGDELPPDYLTRVQEGQFYGWPYAYTGANPDPDLGLRRPDLVAKSRVPDLLFRSHSAPLGLVFYDATQFPQAYRGDAFVALHGSWNAARPRGYMVARVPFEGGRPAGGYESFVSGFWIGGETPPRVWGRPSGLAIAKDGSLLIADDVSGVVWRVAYVGG